jgi:hypothetical protein
MKTAFFVIVLIAAALALAHAAFVPKDIDLSSVDPNHAKVLLGLAQHRCANSTEAECRAFFEPAPFDHCCKVPLTPRHFVHLAQLHLGPNFWT